MDDEHCYRVASSRDGRFDGTFVTAVLTTGIYCRPSCPAMTPKRENVRFYPTPAAAQEAGFRACKRCRPDAAPGSPDWDARADLVARAVRLIGDGEVEREGVGGLSRRLGYSSRQLHRLMSAELGTGPLRLAMAHRVQNARALLETTDLPVTQVAWAAGFASIRQFNDRIREVFALTPSEIRSRRRAPNGPSSGGPDAHRIVAQLTYRPPLDLAGLLEFLGRRAIPGVEWWDGTSFGRVLDLPHGPGTARITAASAAEDHEGHEDREDHAAHPRPRTSLPAVSCTLDLQDIRDYGTAVSRMRRLLDLDADPRAVSAAFSADPLLAPLVSRRPGRRMPGSVSPFEMAVRAVIGQQVSLASARAACGRIVARFGRPVDPNPTGPNPTGPNPTGPDPDGLNDPASSPDPVGPIGDPGQDPCYTFPRPEELAGAAPADLPIPGSRAATVLALSEAVAAGRLVLDPGADRDETERRLLELPGIGPWTASYIRMRALGDPDVFVPGDLVLQRALQSHAAEPAAWKPWRSYAVIHLWASAASAPQAAPPAAPTPIPTNGRKPR